MISTNYLNNLLKKRQQEGRPINVAVMGAGWFGSGLIQELYKWPGMEPRIVFSRNQLRGVNALLNSGINKSDIESVDTPLGLKLAIEKQRYIVCNNLELIHSLYGIDVVFDATGDVEFGAIGALASIKQGIHFVTVSSELDATLGHILNKKARKKGLVYSNCDGDQPGVLARLIREVNGMGFKTIVAGNCKGYKDVHKTPPDILPWVRKGHNPKMVTAFTDGTKQSLELAVVANAFNLLVDKRGMHGLTVTKQTLVENFVNVISEEGIVDHCFGIDGIDQGAGVFVVGKREDLRVKQDLDYLKKGAGPYYLFFRDHHLCYLESPLTVAEAVLLNTSTISSEHKAAQVFAVAKRDLKEGEKLDGIGGFTVYGLVDKYENVKRENLLPVGFSEYAVLNCDVPIDTPISYDMVDFPEDKVCLKLMREERNTLKRKLLGGSVVMSLLKNIRS